MQVSRHGTGAWATLSAAASQVHPVFMLPPLAVASFGALLAARETGDVAISAWALHAGAIFSAVYTAHVKDGLVDFYGRGEDDDHPVTAWGCRRLLWLASLCFLCCLFGLWVVAGTGPVLVTAPTWLIGYLHAPHLDTTPIGATIGYPLGVALALVGGYYAQAGRPGTIALAFGVIFLVLLSGVKVIDDAQDHAYDRTIRKRTVAVALGPTRARRVAYCLMIVALVGVVAAALLGVFPVSTTAAPVVFGVVAALALRAGPELATMLLIRASYLFLALLLGAIWFRPPA